MSLITLQSQYDSGNEIVSCFNPNQNKSQAVMKKDSDFIYLEGRVIEEETKIEGESPKDRVIQKVGESEQ